MSRAASPAAGDGNSRLGRAAARFGIFVLLVIAAAVLARTTPLGDYLTREGATELVENLRGAWWAPVALLAAWLVLTPVGLPASPLMFAGGVVFGVAHGTLLNTAGGMLGGLAGYFLARALGRDLVTQIGGARLERFARQLDRRGFWALVGARFLPIPFPLVNFAMALSGVRPGTFTLSTLLGLVPSMLLWTWFASAVTRAAEGEAGGIFQRLALALFLLIAAIFLPQIVQRMQRARRYRSLLAARTARGRASSSTSISK